MILSLFIGRLLLFLFLFHHSNPFYYLVYLLLVLLEFLQNLAYLLVLLLNLHLLRIGLVSRNEVTSFSSAVDWSNGFVTSGELVLTQIVKTIRLLRRSWLVLMAQVASIGLKSSTSGCW